MSALLADIHPDRIAACFRRVSADQLVDNLLSDPRFADRLSGVVTRHYGLSNIDDDLDDADRMLAALSHAEIESLAIRAGVVLHARQFLQEIRGPVLAALVERFGLAALQDARRGAGLAAEMAKIDDLDVFEAEVVRNGRACLAAWIASLPTSLQRRMWLKWSNEDAVPKTEDAVAHARGPAILKSLVFQESSNA